MSDIHYLAIAFREAKESDQEVDFILDGQSLVVQAIDLIPNPESIAVAHDSMTKYYPECRVVVTHTPLLGMLIHGAQLQELEQEMLEMGLSPANIRKDRISQAFG